MKQITSEEKLKVLYSIVKEIESSTDYTIEIKTTSTNKYYAVINDKDKYPEIVTKSYDREELAVLNVIFMYELHCYKPE